MKKKKKKKVSKRKIRIIIFTPLALLIIVYFFSILFSYTYNIYKLKKEEITLKTELETLEHDEKILKTNIEKLKDPDYIARYARENFQYSKDGEIILKIDTKTEENEEENQDKVEYNTILKTGTFILCIIILYVIIKNRKKNK